ncbi:hypothetical protein SAMN05444170_5220 [Bradyrhizobium erythrophlei]|jgi:hypothetical protein|uniref:Uncharacterized protein n=1 Tax=Bradyrhizobium erythrophlei TaxID=1437360 RepID=A0A1M7UIG8_9BRAD|nr:hypothetical protein SAMN05444170_5220 [Bradyrhizobium erythrophlei]
MICESCRRDVDYVKASFWHEDAMICRECFAQWCDPDNFYASAGDAASVGNYVRLQHGLPPLAATLAVLLLAGTPTAHASRHCLDQAEAARTWPTRTLVKDGDGCWTYDRHPSRAQVLVAAPEMPAVPDTPVPVGEITMADRWDDVGRLRLEPRELEPKPVSQPPSQSGPFESTGQFALFIWIVLAITSVVEVATGGRTSRARRPRWPAQKAPADSTTAEALSGPFRPGAISAARPAPRWADRTGGG